MKIKITKDDIKNGTPCDNEACAVSQALMREFNTDMVTTYLKIKNIVNDKETKVIIYVNDQPYFVNEQDREKVVKFVNQFDNLGFGIGKAPKPITFELNQ
jgi:hypothetical protein